MIPGKIFLGTRVYPHGVTPPLPGLGNGNRFRRRNGGLPRNFVAQINGLPDGWEQGKRKQEYRLSRSAEVHSYLTTGGAGELPGMAVTLAFA